MFELGKKYWFVIEGDITPQYSVKGEVVEENQYMCKIKRDDGSIKLIVFKRLIDTNMERENDKV